jgi:hypothetical protein
VPRLAHARVVLERHRTLERALDVRLRRAAVANVLKAVPRALRQSEPTR